MIAVLVLLAVFAVLGVLSVLGFSSDSRDQDFSMGRMLEWEARLRH